MNRNISSWLPGLLGPLDVQLQGLVQTKRRALNFMGIGVDITDNPEADRLDISIGAANSGPSQTWAPTDDTLPIDVTIKSTVQTNGAAPTVLPISWADIPEFFVNGVANVEVEVCAADTVDTTRFAHLPTVRRFRIVGGVATAFDAATAYKDPWRSSAASWGVVLSWDTPTNRPVVTVTGEAARFIDWTATVYISCAPSTGGAFVPPPAFDMADEVLSLWLRGENATGPGNVFNWPGTASAGSSAAHSLVAAAAGYNYDVAPGGTLDGLAAVEWPAAAPYPLALGATPHRTTLLGGGDSVEASYTIACVVQPLGSNTNAVSGGGKVTAANGCIFADGHSYQGIYLLDDAGTAKFGVAHATSAPSDDGTVPITWPGGFGTWGLLFVSYDHTTSTITVRVNGTTVHTAAIGDVVGPAAADTIGSLAGATGGGAGSAKMRMQELAIWPGVAKTVVEMQGIEADYFAARFPTLGL